MASVEMARGPVIVAIDGSESAEQAFQYYVQRIHRPTNKVLLLHSAEPPRLTAQQSATMSSEVYDELMNQEKLKVRELEESYADKMKMTGVSGTIKATFRAKPGETICEAAKEENASLIVMGTRGLGKIRRTIMGSVSDYVLHHAHCPVLICRH